MKEDISEKLISETPQCQRPALCIETFFFNVQLKNIMLYKCQPSLSDKSRQSTRLQLQTNIISTTRMDFDNLQVFSRYVYHVQHLSLEF